MDHKAVQSRWERWGKCSLCEQEYHGLVRCALGWACWKTYLGRLEGDRLRIGAMNILGLGLGAGKHFEDSLSVKEAELAMLRRVGASQRTMLNMQTNLAISYRAAGRLEEALRMLRGVYSGHLKLDGEDNWSTLIASNNYANVLVSLKRHQEAKSLLHRQIPVARRVLGEGHEATLRMRTNYARALCTDEAATLDDLHKAVTTVEDVAQTARRVLGGAHPTTEWIERSLQEARARSTPARLATVKEDN